MFSSTISPLQLYKPRNLDGLLESNKLSNAFASKPVEMEGTLAYAFGTMRGAYGGNIMNLITQAAGNTVTVDNDRYRWKLYTQGARIIEVAGQNIDGGSTPGIGFTKFRVPVLENFFEDGDNVLLDDNRTVLRVSGDVQHDGVNYVHTFQLVTTDPTAFVDPKLVGPGGRMSKEYNTQPELSLRGSGVSLSTGIELENRLGIFRKTLAISRGAQTDVMAMDIMLADGTKTRIWDTAATWQATYEFAHEIDTQMVYGTKQDGQIIGSNGRPVYTGAGFREQISPNNKWEFSKLTYNLIDDFFSDLAYNAQRQGGKEKFIVLTGQDGMRAANEVLTEKFKGTGYILTDSNKFLGGDGNDLELKGHFSKVQLMNDIEVSFRLFPAYDDKDRNRLLNPKTGRPLESSRMTVLNVGQTKDGKANLQKVVKKDSEKFMWEVGGSTTSAGTRKGSQGASGLDGREVHWLEESGGRMKDPTSCGELIPAGA